MFFTFLWWKYTVYIVILKSLEEKDYDYIGYLKIRTQCFLFHNFFMKWFIFMFSKHFYKVLGKITCRSITKEMWNKEILPMWYLQFSLMLRTKKDTFRYWGSLSSKHETSKTKSWWGQLVDQPIDFRDKDWEIGRRYKIGRTTFSCFF